ncbi:LPS export ABC transporter periplasmic protein LptC [Pseudochelatococcus contaminans]|uniref:Lipopolysaccharide export system protein LptC n=1 Tax=Pseudochelatococcus contaminans TaxID=1538103 RepID=A0A7W5Z377_9HYPH|nr:LPS export ABC transporter periplasmic protein LptC [Pseudochelatococcus contaminans]MBB3809306.1 lipopolysaccharide export system protein LptC [Pseudochelatococcus contaminans]
MTDAKHPPASPRVAPQRRQPVDLPIAGVSPAAYRAALRHSARVRTMKRLIPIAALGAIVIVTAIGVLKPLSSIGGLSLGPVSLSGSKITMEAPKLSGFRDGTQPYELTASSASQDVKNPAIVELDGISGHLELSDGGQARISAATGVYDSQVEHLTLNGDVRVRTDSGYDVKLSSAAVDFKGGRVTSEEPVEVTISEGTISADRLDISDNGKHIVFEGRVRTVLDGGDGAR